MNTTVCIVLPGGNWYCGLVVRRSDRFIHLRLIRSIDNLYMLELVCKGSAQVHSIRCPLLRWLADYIAVVDST